MFQTLMNNLCETYNVGLQPANCKTVGAALCLQRNYAMASTYSWTHCTLENFTSLIKTPFYKNRVEISQILYTLH